MDVGIVNRGIFVGGRYKNPNKTTPDLSFNKKEESVCTKKPDRDELTNQNKSSVLSSDEIDALYDELAKRYDLTDVKQSDFENLLDELHKNGLITDYDRMIAGGVYVADAPLENKVSEKSYGRYSDEKFNAVTDYKRSYLDYAQSINYEDHQVIKDAILAHNKISEIIENIAQRSQKS